MKVFYKKLLFILMLSPLALSAQNNFWREITDQALKTTEGKILIHPLRFRGYSLDTLGLKWVLHNAPAEFTPEARTSPLVISLPLPDGSIEHFSVVETQMMEPGLSATFPEFKTFSGQGVEDRSATLQMDWTATGFHAQIFSALKDKSMYIDPYALGNKVNYIIYAKTDLPAKEFKENGVETDGIPGVVSRTDQINAGFCFGSQLRRYRLAVAATGEYTFFFGSVANAQAAIVTTVNRVNGIYEKEVGVRMVLVANNNLIVYPDSLTDPYTVGSVNSTLLSQNQTAIDAAIGTANYDIGHLVTTINGGGLAGLGVVCVAGNKARAATGLANPSGDSYDVDYVAHEMGHQFSGTHTFNAATGSCGGGNRSAATAVEPGSGVTIMAYAGICTATNNLEQHSIPYFHTISQGQLGNYTNTGNGSTCATVLTTGNTAPVVNAGSNYTIPISTPFALTGSASDADNDFLTYSWEEFDAGITAGDWNSGNAPFFRSFRPVTSPTRYFPKLSDIANNTTTIGEYLPATPQILNFRLTARDNRSGGGGVCSGDMVLTVAGTAPFRVTSQSAATTWTTGSSATIAWDVAGTTAAPFNTANVTILFSSDGGATFPYTLLNTTTNSGTANIVVPNINTTRGKVMVKALGNVFFSENTAFISITSSCAAEGATILPATDVNATPGSSILNLNLSPQFSTAFAPSGTITTADPSTNLVVASATSTCMQYSNIYNYDAYTFNVTVTGTYTFTRTGSGSVFNIYTNSFNPSSLCTNWLTSNFVAGTGTFASISVGLTAGVTYILVEGVYGTDATTPATSLPFNYSFTVMPPTGGAIYTGSSVYLNPGSGFSYAYVIVNNATNQIVAISSTANLSNSTTYPTGAYTVYGVSYNSSNSLTSFVGVNFSNFTTAISTGSTYCANISKNSVAVTISTTLPVQFLPLTAKKLTKNSGLLQWGTASEVNTSHFDIERSSDGRNFSSVLGKTPAAGNSTTVKNYSFTDNSPLKGANYYRIKQVDKDGKIAYSNTALLNFNGDGAISIYPNPAISYLTVEYADLVPGKMQIQVIDGKGAVVVSQLQQVVSGMNTAKVNVANLATGMYTIKCMEANGNTHIMKFVKQ